MKGIEEIVQAQHRVLMIILAPQSSVPADMTTNLPNVRFGPESGHSPTRSGCLLWANNRACMSSGLLCSRMAHLGEEEFGLAVRHQGYPHCRCRYPHHG
jgi:hypothetical protein